jgi:hypothetical protein
MRYFVRYHYRDKATGATVFSDIESISKFVSNYLASSIIDDNPLYYSVEDMKEGFIWYDPLFWR